jgi:hypothetical protein
VGLEVEVEEVVLGGESPLSLAPMVEEWLHEDMQLNCLLQKSADRVTTL